MSRGSQAPFHTDRIRLDRHLAATDDARNDQSGRTAGDVLEAARDAFTTAVDAVAAIGAVLFVLLAILAAVALRKIHPRRDVTPSYSGT